VKLWIEHCCREVVYFTVAIMNCFWIAANTVSRIPAAECGWAWPVTVWCCWDCIVHNYIFVYFPVFVRLMGVCFTLFTSYTLLLLYFENCWSEIIMFVWCMSVIFLYLNKHTSFTHWNISLFLLLVKNVQSVPCSSWSVDNCHAGLVIESETNSFP